jgi:hypothetical protein
MRGQIKLCYLTRFFYLALFDLTPELAFQANCIKCAVLLVLPPLGQADILPFGKNLLQAAPAAPAPCPKGLWAPLLSDTVITLTLLLFRRIRLFFFISPAWFFRYSSPSAMRALKITM